MQLPRALRQSGKHCFRFYEDCIPFGGVEAEVEDGQSLPRWGFVTAEWVLGGTGRKDSQATLSAWNRP